MTTDIEQSGDVKYKPDMFSSIAEAEVRLLKLQEDARDIWTQMADEQFIETMGADYKEWKRRARFAHTTKVNQVAAVKLWLKQNRAGTITVKPTRFLIAPDGKNYLVSQGEMKQLRELKSHAENLNTSMESLLNQLNDAAAKRGGVPRGSMDESRER